jgi:membrane dipeptidase
MLASALLFSALLMAQESTPANTPPLKSRSSANQGWRAIHDSAIIIDTHADTPGRFVDENFDLSQDAGTGYMDFNEIKAGNLGAEFFSIWVEPKANKGNEAKRALDMIDSVYEQARRHPDKNDDGLQHSGHSRRPSPAQICRFAGRGRRSRH